jgi:hypothetical protein
MRSRSITDTRAHLTITPFFPGRDTNAAARILQGELFSQKRAFFCGTPAQFKTGKNVEN